MYPFESLPSTEINFKSAKPPTIRLVDTFAWPIAFEALKLADREREINADLKNIYQKGF